jgi:metallo-beta-lactamase class B
MKSALAFICLLYSVCSFAQASATWRSWNEPVEPFRIVGNVYYVGAREVSSFLITSAQGHILLDGGFVESAAIIRDNIRKLGFKPEDVKYLVGSHAHFDHAGGLAQLKQWTGARFAASREDGALMVRGGRGDFAFGDKLTFPAVVPDKILVDGDGISVGDARMIAHLTPGHTKGCTTWTTEAEENGRSYHVVFLCSTSVPGYTLVHNPAYPNIADDYRSTFAFLKSLPCDVFLAPHGSMFRLSEKLVARKNDVGRNSFIDVDEFQAFVDRSKREFERELKKQRTGR